MLSLLLQRANITTHHHKARERKREKEMGSNRKNNMGLMFVPLVSLVLVLQGWLLPSIQGAVHYYDFILMEKNFTKLCSTKSILTVNGSFPGPEIRIHAGDTVFVNVHNKGKYGVTIHWHGVRQPRNPWSDGPEYVTQCPIAVGTNFTQEIIFTKEVGTLWWHAHSDWTRATVHGPIIILPPAGTSYPFPKPYAEQTLVLGEWYKGDVMAMIEYATTYGADTNVSDAYTINGEPGDFYNCSSDTTYRLLVDYGKTYHLRVINSVMNEETWFGIANHTLTVVGMDAAYLKPITVDYILITPGQTMDVLVTANQTPSHYYIMGAPFSDTPGAADTTNTTAILQYNGNYTKPTTPPSPTFPGRTNTTAAANFTSLLRSLASKKYPVDVPVNITKNVFMTIAVNQLPNTTCPNNTCASGNGNRPAASLTNISFVNPSIDFLQAYYYNLNGVFERDFPDVPPLVFNYTGDEANNYLIPLQATKALMIDYNAEVELVWQGTNLGAENHPMHLHGYSFYVVGQGFGNFDNVTSPLTYNLVDPPEVNTFAVPKNGWVALRFKADNPGVWFMHCHLERHASWGMDTVVIVKNGPTKLASIKPPPSMPSCS